MIQGVEVKKLKVIPDERGLIMEILRSDDSFYKKFGQCYLSVVNPGVIKAWHFHKIQTDHFTVIKGMAKIVLYDTRENSKTYQEINEFFSGEQNPCLIVIPPMVAHGMKGISMKPAYVINCPTELYNYDNPDEHRLDPFDKKIPYNWELKHG
jgi:dTDP-4-dehydrorhamnose 3,5-epimerase